ncbi:phosphotransferase [Dongia sp.]|uniref:phosphotransferase n=1 Tax=Dongia sp. TaxID=1977262 RepID=UPI0035AF48BC
MIDQAIENPTVLTPAATALLARACLYPPYRVHALTGGKNNRVLKIAPAAGEPVVLKMYFQHPDDPRDRLGHEWAFSRYAWVHNIRAVPEPLLQDGDRGMALYQFVAGMPFGVGEVGGRDVEAACKFIRDLNQARESADAAFLPAGSEACFTIAQHLDLLERRLRQLSLVPATPETQPMLDWLHRHLMPTWKLAESRTRSLAARADIPLGEVLSKPERLVSPSDFGFHNALRRPSGEICFLDFEYAGWDDPAKLCGDFFNQIEVPVALDHLPSIETALTSIAPRPELLRWRIAALLPVYAIKWCCICLGPYLRAGLTRRQFAGNIADDWHEHALARAVRQFAKVQATLDLAPRA